MVLLHNTAGRGVRPKLLSPAYVMVMALATPSLDGGCSRKCSHLHPVHVDIERRRTTRALDSPPRIRRRSMHNFPRSCSVRLLLPRSDAYRSHFRRFGGLDLTVEGCISRHRLRGRASSPKHRQSGPLRKPSQEPFPGFTLCLYPVSRHLSLLTLDLCPRQPEV
ncbi:hypothetical protein BD309DRAFT_955955 [Dichomitus squalens]|nr:hypothetical protein BD309DRAFT_955955 [Dichomitus squalens]